MNKTRYSATEFGRNKPMNFRPSGTLIIALQSCCRSNEIFSVDTEVNLTQVAEVQYYLSDIGVDVCVVLCVFKPLHIV